MYANTALVNSKKKSLLFKAEKSKAKEPIISTFQSPEVAFNLGLKRAGKEKKATW